MEALRRRLLDLTRRNSLLNYRHPKLRSLRVVDKLPDQLFTELSAGSKFVLTPVPLPPKFQDADESIRNLYPEHIGQRVRPDSVTWAKHHGIRIDYELPKTASTEDGRHGDRKMQTLFYPEDLEAQLANISRVARTAMEESGVNILYLAFGFIEWKDNVDSGPNLAPLVLLPVTLTRTGIDRQTRRYKYEIEYSEEDFESNLSLKEKLRNDFDLELPELKEDELPEAYMDRCRPILRAYPEWKFHRYVTLGFFQFGKLLMYLDLDSANWPEDQKIEDHHIIKRIMTGDMSGEVEYASLHPTDDLKHDSPEFQLIQEADSTQHSAIVDAASGKNLVIEGPPGTGKSQTITNIIAVALNLGKSILFVSEKLAALQVVKDRLDKAGFGAFCLELHSNRASKKKFYEELKLRRNFTITSPSEHALNTKVTEVQRARAALNSYATLINCPAPKVCFSYNELFCKCVRLKGLIPNDILKIQVLKGDAQEYDLDEVWMETVRTRITRCGVIRNDLIQRHGMVNAHPWSYLFPIVSMPNDGSTPVEDINYWHNTLQEIELSLGHFSAIGIKPKELTLRQLDEIGKLQENLPSPEIIPIHTLTEVLKNETGARLLQIYANKEKSLTESYNLLTSHYDTLRLTDLNWLTAAVDAVASIKSLPVELRAKSIKAVLQIRDAINNYVTLQKDATKAICDIHDQLSIQAGTSTEVVRTSISILHCVRSVPWNSLPYRYPGLEQISENHKLGDLVNELSTLRKEKARTEMLFSVDQSHNVEKLSVAADILQHGSLLSVFDGEWRSANKVYKEACKAGSLFKLSRVKGRELANLIALKRQISEFELNPRYAELLGRGFKGLSTPIEHYVALISWYMAVKHAVGSQQTAHTTISMALINMPVDKLQILSNYSGSERLPILEQTAGTISTLCNNLSGSEVQMLIGSPAEDASLAAMWAKRLQEATETLTEGLNQVDQTVSRLGLLLNQFKMQVTDHELIRARQTLGISRHSGTTLDIVSQALLNSLVRWSEIPWNSTAAEALRNYYLDSLARNVLPAAFNHMSRFIKHSTDEKAAYATLCKNYYVVFDPNDVESNPRDVTLGGAEKRLKLSIDNQEEWNAWVSYTNSLHAIRSLDSHLKHIARAYHRGDITTDQMHTCAEYLFYNTHAQNAVRKHKELFEFDTNTHDNVRRRFTRLDDELCNLHRQLIAARLCTRRPPRGTSGQHVGDMTEMILLDHQLSLTRPRLSMRQLMARAGRALQVLKPCFMMGPLSVAQFLKPGSIHFDLIVMDEASQMRPEDAIGAIGRGTQLIVVGDPKQLPPTTFFDHIESEEGPAEEDLVVRNQESILETVTPLFSPVRSLGWHYRSQHESLIAFSNRQFYGNRLLLFPSSLAKSDDLGIDYKSVMNGVCNRSVNECEASEVVRGAIREIKRTGGRYTVGIVAMNVQQQAAIQDEWDRQLRELPELLEVVDKIGADNEEPFFIKNLENVQGDERDIIVLSMTYGPDTNGNFYQRFGPINQQNGWRRLNVLFTRSRRKMIVYSSMRSEQIVADKQANAGPAALRGFLEYCERGILVDLPATTDRPPANAFEEEVAEIVTQTGFRAVPQVGVSGYFIDIGVTHDTCPGQYFLGIECDGAPYHSAKCARDRDKLRQRVLESMGWTIHRIWSTDWYSRHNPERQRLIAVLNRIKEQLPHGELLAQNTQQATDRRKSDRDGNELKFRLHELRRTIESEFPEVPAGKRLLRNDVLELLLMHKPVSRDEFSRYIPREIRNEIDINEAHRYLETVFSVIDDNS